MAIELEKIKAWDGQSGTGADNRGVIDRNFDKVETELENVDLRFEDVEDEIVQLAGNIDAASVASIFPVEVNGYTDSNTGGLAAPGTNTNSNHYRTTGYIKLLKGTTIQTNAKGSLANIVVSRIEAIGTVLDRIYSNTFSAVQDCFVQINNDTRLNNANISYAIYGFEDKIEIIEDKVEIIEDKVEIIEDKVEIIDTSIFNDINSLVGTNLDKGAFDKAMHKIEMYNYHKDAKFYMAVFSMSCDNGVYAITLAIRDADHDNRRFVINHSTPIVDSGSGIAKIPLQTSAYTRYAAGDSQRISEDEFPTGYLYIKTQYLPQILGGSFTIDNTNHNVNFGTTGLKNVQTLNKMDNVIHAQVASAVDVTIGAKRLINRTKSFIDVNYKDLKTFDISNYFIIDTPRVSNYPEIIDRIYPTNSAGKPLLFQDKIDYKFVWLDSNGAVYLSDNENGATSEDIIHDGVLNIDTDDYKICNVLALGLDRYLFQVHAVREVGGLFRVCAENYLFTNGVLTHKFDFPYADYDDRSRVKSIIDFRTPRNKSQYGDIVTVCDYGSKEYAGVVYISYDRGDTWRCIFRMKAQGNEPRIPADIPFGDDSHVHSAFYDPYRKSVLVTTGDVSRTEENISNRSGSGIHECRNLQDEDLIWEYNSISSARGYYSFSDAQFVTGIALPNCQLFGSDNGQDVGIFRLNDTGGSISNKLVDKAFILEGRATAIDGIRLLGDHFFKLSNGLILALFHSYDSNPELDGNPNYPSVLAGTYDGYVWDRLYNFTHYGDASRFAFIRETEKYIYIRARGVTAQSQARGLPSGTYLTDEQIERGYLIKMSKPF